MSAWGGYTEAGRNYWTPYDTGIDWTEVFVEAKEAPIARFPLADPGEDHIERGEN